MWRSGFASEHDSNDAQLQYREPAPGKVTRSERISRRANGGAVTADPDAAVASASGSTGSMLPDHTRAQFENSLGADLSSVRVHTGDSSASAAADLGARAFAVGNDIHFGAGQYQPDDPFGMHLLAHEVAHTVQQAGSGPRFKLEVSMAGDSFELEADRAADAMVTGAPAFISSGFTQVSRQAAEPTADQKPATEIFVEFTKDGAWDGAQVLAKLQTLGPIPQDLQSAILAGPKPTASYCVALRDKVSADADPAKKAQIQQITASLTTRVTELVYATTRSPLQYSQLAEVANWGQQYGAGMAAPGGQSAGQNAVDKTGTGAEAGAAGTPGGDKAQAHATTAAETFATKLATEAGARVHGDSKDQIRDAKFQANDEHQGSESGDAALNGWTFLRDPFDNTVTAVRPDGTGIQFSYLAEGAPGSAPTMTLVRTLELSKLRVGALKRQDKMAPGEAQEGADGPGKRRAQDKANGDKARAQFRIDHPAEMKTYDDAMKAWTDGGKQGNPPSPPKGYPTDKQTTSCPLTPNDVYKAADPAAEGFFPFSPQTQWQSWRTLATHPQGPSPGDVYYLWDIAKSWVAHMGVFKSAAPVSGKEDLWTWTVTDGGQGGYAQIQQNQERTRGPFNKKTGIFSSSIAEAGQSKGDRKLYGWVDIDAFRANPEKVPEQKK